MAWTESHQSLATHRKMIAFADELGVNRAEAIGWLHLFWWWALDNAPSGNLKGIKAEHIATAIAYPNDSNTFLSALISAGFVDHCGRAAIGVRIHNWDKYGGKLLQARAKHKESTRRARASLENSTVDNSREQKSRSQPHPPPPPAARGGSEDFIPDDGDPYREPTDQEVAATVAAVRKRFGKNAKFKRVGPK